LDGQAHDPEQFFRDELGSPLPSIARVPINPAPYSQYHATSSTISDTPGTAQRRAARDGVRLLAGLARSDGIMHAAEVEVIVNYIVDRAARDGIQTQHEDRLALSGYIKRQRPAIEVLEGCLDRLHRAPTEEQHLFLRSALALIEADNQRHAKELAILAELQHRLTAPPAGIRP